MTTTATDPWADLINQVLADRGSDIRIEEVDQDLWDEFLGPMIDRIEDGESEDNRQ